MKILTRGEVKDKAYQAQCRKCNSTLEFTKNDGVILWDRNESVLKVSCPICNSDIHVNC